MALRPNQDRARQFDRYVPINSRTIALRAFNRHETELNKHFWSFKVIAEYAGYLARRQRESDPTHLTERLFCASGVDASRIPRTVEEWLVASKELENWLRISALVSASSYLEAYVRQVGRTALLSDPLGRIGHVRSLDGTQLLKIGAELPYTEELGELTRGEWTKRRAAFSSIFRMPQELLGEFDADLEFIRRARNNFAHGFGRDLDAPEPDEKELGGPLKISQNRLIKCLGVISKVAKKIDEFLIQNCIGNFEYIYFYHKWHHEIWVPDAANISEDRALKRAIIHGLNTTVSAGFCRGLIEFYRSA